VTFRFWILSGLLLASSAVTLGQAKPASTSYQRFVGTWGAQFQGKTFVTLKLSVQGQSLGGTITGAFIHLDPEGNLVIARPKPNERQIIEAKLTGDVLAFKAQEADKPPVSFKMKLTSADAGELTLIIPPRPGEPVPRPWKIVRESKTDSGTN
jgi:hypothetical protein